MKYFRLFFSSLFFVFFLMPLIAQPALNQKIDAVYEAFANQPGAMVGIWKDGKVLFAKSYGLANLPHQVPFTTYTTSDIGSVAKQFTCYAILLLEQDGKLSLNDDIRSYLPFIPDFGKTISILNLMNHTSGIREIYSTENIRGGRAGDAIFQSDIISLMERQEGLNFEPGTEFMYCNTAYALLAEIVERVGGQPFEHWMFEHIFEPLGMHHTFIMDRQGEIFPQMADSYYLQSDSVYTVVFDNSTIRGQGGIYSCLEDMMKWMKNLATARLGGPIIMEKMTERAVLENSDTLRYAKGLYVDRFRGMDRIFHSGSSAGYRSGLTYFPDHDLGIFVNTNAPNVPLYETMELITEHFLEAYIQDEPRSAESSSTNSNDQPASGSIDPTYAGRYISPELEAIYELFIEDGQLMGRHFRHGVFVLHAESQDEFTSDKGFFPKVKFERDKKGKVVGLLVSTSRAKNIRFVKQ